MLELRTLQSKAWKELSPAEKLIYIRIKANFNGVNNGEISFTYSEARDEFSDATIWRALKGLEKKEWIVKTKHGGLFRFYCLYKLTGKYDRILHYYANNKHGKY
jgi:predicted transcriptional regulator